MNRSFTIRGSRVGPTRIMLSAVLTLVVVACGTGSGASLAPAYDEDGANAYGGDARAPGAGAAAVPSAAPSGATGDAVGTVDDARIVRTGSIELLVQDVPQAVGVARDAIRGLGGYIGASNTFNDGDEPVAEITYRVPVDRWEEALTALRGLNGLTTEVVTEQTDAVEVTGQIVDLEARIRNLRASESALQAIAAQAVRISDVLEVQAQLTDVRGQIEQLTAQLVDLGNRADFATLTATYRVQVVAVDIAQQNWDPAVVVDEASASMVDLLQALASAGIWFAIVWLPIIVVLGVLAIAATWVLRRFGIIGRSKPPFIPPAAPPAPPSEPIPSGS